ncbi:unnamed protein product [Mytilus edulis]|uniref:Uncharacterized protein n=1 Tax=Mytilus edulis TaxID=6550 RepID=A0A8S3TY72_MYTED|nr:unnamed protein product [Mytilus edulis]
MDTDYMSGDCIDTMDVDEAQLYNSPSVFSNRQKHNSGSNRSVESDDTQSEAEDANLYDSQNEDDVIDDEDHLADLMTASSTICFASQRQSAKDKESRKKGMKKKDTTIAMLAPDLLEVDPHNVHHPSHPMDVWMMVHSITEAYSFLVKDESLKQRDQLNEIKMATNIRFETSTFNAVIKYYNYHNHIIMTQSP